MNSDETFRLWYSEKYPVGMCPNCKVEHLLAPEIPGFMCVEIVGGGYGYDGALRNSRMVMILWGRVGQTPGEVWNTNGVRRVIGMN